MARGVYDLSLPSLRLTSKITAGLLVVIVLRLNILEDSLLVKQLSSGSRPSGTTLIIKSRAVNLTLSDYLITTKLLSSSSKIPLETRIKSEPL
jgi:hypothetical protein